MNRKEEMRALADNIEYRYNSSKNESGSGRVMVLYHHELPVIAAALRASAAPEEGMKEASAAQHFDLKGKPAKFVRNGILETCRCLRCRALPSDSGKAAPVAWRYRMKDIPEMDWRYSATDMSSESYLCEPLYAALAPATEEPTLRDAQ